MLEKFIKSKRFEKKFFFLRKHIPYFNRRYTELNGIGPGLRSPQKNEKAAEAINRIKEPLRIKQKNKEIPKIIWLYWNSPLDEAPEVVRLSIRTWKELNPEYEFKILTNNNLKDVLGFDFNSAFDNCNIRMPIAIKADLLRLYLLSSHGGVWVDATTLCLKPLSAWLERVTAPHNFYIFRRFDKKTRPVEVWFIAAPQHSPIVNDALNLFVEHLFKNRKLAIFVSNNKRRYYKNLGHQGRLYADCVYAAEKFGVMPYFSLSYFFNESLRSNLSETDNRDLFMLPNQHANQHSSFDDFKDSLVAKLTYKNNYEETDDFLLRKNFILGLLIQQSNS